MTAFDLFAPRPDSTVSAAARWVEQVLLGSIATSIAIIAVAVVGFLMLSGRVDVRRAASVVIGCFILFGASTIVSGLRSITSGEDAEVAAMPPSSPPPPPVLAPQAPPEIDPYAGASVPR